jgi:hypothetical protein
MTKKIGYSHSALEMFDSCPWAYKKVRLDRIPRAASDPLIIGSTVHDIVAQYLQRLVNTRQQTDWEWAKARIFNDVPADVAEIWEKFWNRFIMPPYESGGIEMKLAFTRAWEPCEYFADDAYFRSVVDWTYRQDGLVVIQDWKTNQMIPPSIGKNLQLRIYGWGVRRAIFPDAQEILLRLHFLRYSFEQEILLEPEDLDTIPQELEIKIAKIEAEKHFDPTPGSYCGWCGVIQHCPVMESALVPATILYPVSQADALKAATLLLAMQKMSEAIKEHLETYVRESGAVQVGDLTYGPIPRVDYEIDPKAITEKLLNIGFEREEVWKVLSIGKTSLDQGLKAMGLTGKRSKERRDLMAEILDQSPKKETERIGWKKHG